MRNGRELGINPGGGIRSQSSADHQGKAGKLGKEEQACPEWRSKDVIQATVLTQDRQGSNNHLAIARAR